MHIVFKDNLGLSAYKKGSKHLISEASKEKELDKGKLMFGEIRRATDTSGPAKRYSLWMLF